MRRILILLLLIGFTCTSDAQIRVATELGWNISSMSRKVDDISIPLLGAFHIQTTNKAKSGFRAGALVDVPLSENVSLQPGVFYSSQSVHTTFDLGFFNVEQELNVKYLLVPVNVLYKFGTPDNDRFFIGFGPYFGYALGGTSDKDATLGILGDLVTIGGALPILPVAPTGDIKVGTDSASSVRPFDFGLNVNMGYELSNGFFVRGQFGMGILETAPLGNNTQKNICGTVSVGYLIGLKKKRTEQP